jgi:SAM-dependent methyltransferase
MRGSTRSSDWRAITADLNPSPYDVFASYYDAFTAESDYEVWTEQVLGVAGQHGLSGAALLDVACGTGNSFMPFVRRGFRVTGCDGSAAMLAEAARKAPDVALVRADMRELTTLGRFDLVTCFDDSLNYLPDADGLMAALHGIAANLARHGLALFDLNTLRAYRTTFASDSVAERDGVVFAWRGQCPPDAEPGCLAAAEIDVFAPATDSLYERVTSRHEQRHFPCEEVVELITAADLECVAIHGVLADGTLVPAADELRHLKSLFIARHARGGDAQ